MSGLVQPTERFRFAVEAHTPLMKFPHQGFFPGTCSCYIPSRRSKGIGEPTPIARNSSMDHANGDAVEDVVFDVANVRDAAREVLDAAQALRDLVFTDGFDEAAVPAAVDRVRNATDNLPATVVDEDKRVSAYRELVNLHNIDAHNPVLKVALREWEKKAKDLNKKVTRREARSADLTNQIFNIIGFFAVFQGVVLTAVTQLTQTAKGPLCGKIWFPIVLTGVGAVITIGGILYKFQGLRSFELTINTEKQAQQEAEKRVNLLRRRGPRNFKFSRDVNDDLKKTLPKELLPRFILVAVSLVVLTGLFILSYFVILCDTGIVHKWDGGLHG